MTFTLRQGPRTLAGHFRDRVQLISEFFRHEGTAIISRRIQESQLFIWNGFRQPIFWRARIAVMPSWSEQEGNAGEGGQGLPVLETN